VGERSGILTVKRIASGEQVKVPQRVLAAALC